MDIEEIEIKDAVETTRRIMEDVELPESWGVSAFGIILDRLLSRRTGSVTPSAVPHAALALTSSPVTGLTRLATRLGVSESALADVFAIEGDDVSLHVASTKLPVPKSKATREIGLLIVAARQGAGIDESWTDVAYVRDALTQYNRYDASNFSKYLRETGDVFNLRGRPAQLRLTRPGWEAATELMQNLTGSAQ